MAAFVTEQRDSVSHGTFAESRARPIPQLGYCWGLGRADTHQKPDFSFAWAQKTHTRIPRSFSEFMGAATSFVNLRD